MTALVPGVLSLEQAQTTNVPQTPTNIATRRLAHGAFE